MIEFWFEFYNFVVGFFFCLLFWVLIITIYTTQRSKNICIEENVVIPLLFIVPNKKNIICGVLYRQHNSPESFLSYFNDTVERFDAYDKPVYIAGDFNIDLLKSESWNYAHNSLLSLQSYSFIPLIDKPTCVYGNSATLIDNILVNNATNLLSSRNIISDISDHFSQFCVMSNIFMKKNVAGLKKVRDFSHFYGS